MIHEPITYSAAFLIGLLGGAHCVGMCGGIMGALAFSVPPEKRVTRRLIPLLFAFNIGRILSYTLAGALIGMLTWIAAEQFKPVGLVLRYVAGLMLILLGLYLAGWWPVLRHLERAGGKLWAWIQPGVKALTPVKNPFQALLIGTLWGWLPCGLVYSSLTWAAAAPEWRQSALIMLFFGLGTLPTLIATGLLLEKITRLMQSKGFRQSAALLIILFGVWTLPIQLGAQHQGHSMHQEDQGHHSSTTHQD